MRIAASSTARRTDGWSAFGALAAAVLVVGVAFVVANRLDSSSIVVDALLGALVVAPLWMLTTSNYAASLGVLMLYLGLADGYLKLKLDVQAAALGRDVLFYSIVLGATVRLIVDGRRLRIPPLTGWVVAFLLVVGVQIFNPDAWGLTHSLAALRQHIEWLPLFFFGYAVMRERRRLRAFLVLACLIGAVNGVVGFVQFNLTPEQLAGWGPGYAKRINGSEGGTSPRAFADETGKAYNRPFALGNDIGFGGATAVLAGPALLALLALSRLRWERWAAVVLAAGVVAAVITSQSRSAVLAAVVAVIAFAALAVNSRRAVRLLVAIAFVGLLTYGTIAVLANGSSSSALSRYDSIAPTRVLGSTYDYRKSSLSLLPETISAYPFGHGLGTVGPAAGAVGANAALAGFSGETELNFLAIELGLTGLLVLLAFTLRLLVLSTRVRRIGDHELRILLAGCLAPLFGYGAEWIAGAVTTGTPSAPYFWFAAGIVAYWMVQRAGDWSRADVQVARAPAAEPALVATA